MNKRVHREANEAPSKRGRFHAGPLMAVVVLICCSIAILLFIPNNNPSAGPPGNKSKSKNTTDSEPGNTHVAPDSTDQTEQAHPQPQAPQSERLTPVCEYLEIPYQTIEYTDSKLPEGVTRVEGGRVGSKKECSYKSGVMEGVITERTILTHPVTKVIYTGTYTYEQGLSDARYACRHTQDGSTDRTDCITDKIKSYGF